MRYSKAEKMEIIRLVEDSDRPVKWTLDELGIARSTFYEWYQKYHDNGYDGLEDRLPCPRQFWNRIPDSEREHIVDTAIANPEMSPRQLAWHIVDTEGYFISESSVYRILKAYDLVAPPAYDIVMAAEKFHTPTRRVNEMWQTDFTYLKVIGWGWYYLTSILDDFSRYIIAWELCTSMSADDVKRVLDKAIAITGADGVRIKHRPRLLSDNGPCYVSKALKEHVDGKLVHIRGANRHPQTQGKIERYHRTMKNVIRLDNYYQPGHLELEIARFVDYYNNERYHESLDNLRPVDVYLGRGEEILDRRAEIKQITLERRKFENLRMAI